MKITNQKKYFLRMLQAKIRTYLKIFAPSTIIVGIPVSILLPLLPAYIGAWWSPAVTFIIGYPVMSVVGALFESVQGCFGPDATKFFKDLDDLDEQLEELDRRIDELEQSI